MRVRRTLVFACSSGGWALDMRPTWIPGGALRLPPGLFGSILPLNSSLRTLQMARVAVRLYTALAARLRYATRYASTHERRKHVLLRTIYLLRTYGHYNVQRVH